MTDGMIVTLKRRRGPYKLLKSANYWDDYRIYLKDLPNRTLFKVLKVRGTDCLLQPLHSKGRIVSGTWVECIHLKPLLLNKDLTCLNYVIM